MTLRAWRRDVITARWWLGFGLAVTISLPGALWATFWGGDQTIGFLGTIPVFAYVILTVTRLSRGPHVPEQPPADHEPTRGG